MELRITIVTILILFLINSVFSLVYKDNIRNTANASNESYYSPIFSKDLKTKVGVVEIEEDTETKENENEPTEDATQPANYIYYTPAVTTTPQDEQPTDTPPPADTPPQDETETPDEGDNEEEDEGFPDIVIGG